MAVNQTKKADGTTHLTFQSKRIKGSPVGLLISVIPASIVFTSCTFFKVAPRVNGTSGLVWLVATIALCAIIYQVLKAALFMNSHYADVTNGVLVFDSKQYLYADLLDFATTRDADGEQCFIHARYKGDDVKLTGWMSIEDAEAALKVMRKRAVWVM